MMSVLRALRVVSHAVLLGTALLPQRVSTADKKECVVPQTTVDSTYKPGQVWSYKTRPGESSSTITILRVETTPKLGTIIHIRVDDVQFRDCNGARPAPTSIAHAPFAKAAIDKSVIRQLRSVSTLPDFEAGYSDWLAHCGGVYTVSVAEMDQRGRHHLQRWFGLHFLVALSLHSSSSC
jgi:hypothetical protein